MIIRQPVHLYLDGQEVLVNPDSFVSQGGEAVTYKVADLILKLYKDPNKVRNSNMIHKIKLQTVFNHPYIISPKGFVYDRPDSKEPIGFYMDFAYGEDLRILFTANGRKKHGFKGKHDRILAERMRLTVLAAHAYRCTMGDANDNNWRVDLEGNDGPKPRVVDVDSWKMFNWETEAILPTVKDPHSDNFTQESDWFTWAVVTFNLFTGLHPYSGNAEGYSKKEIAALGLDISPLEKRMLDNRSVLTDGVGTPPAYRGTDAIPDELLKWYKQVFNEGYRGIPPMVKDLGEPIFKSTVAPKEAKIFSRESDNANMEDNLEDDDLVNAEKVIPESTKTEVVVEEVSVEEEIAAIEEEDKPKYVISTKKEDRTISQTILTWTGLIFLYRAFMFIFVWDVRKQDSLGRPKKVKALPKATEQKQKEVEEPTEADEPEVSTEELEVEIPSKKVVVDVQSEIIYSEHDCLVFLGGNFDDSSNIFLLKDHSTGQQVYQLDKHKANSSGLKGKNFKFDNLYNQTHKLAGKILYPGMVLTQDGDLYDLNTQRFIGWGYSPKCDALKVDGGYITVDLILDEIEFTFISDESFKSKVLDIEQEVKEFVRFEDRIVFITTANEMHELEWDLELKEAKLSEDFVNCEDNITWFEGCGVEVKGKKTYIHLLTRDSFTRMKISELQGKEVVDVVAGNSFLAVLIRTPHGALKRLEFTIASDMSYAYIEELKEDNNLVVLPKGLVAQVYADGLLRVYSPINGAVNLASSKHISQKLQLYRWNNLVCFVKDGLAYSLQMRRE